jgi:hypothetical protein
LSLSELTSADAMKRAATITRQGYYGFFRHIGARTTSPANCSDDARC